MVPFLDLRAQFKEIREEIWKELSSLFASQKFILGSRVEELEKRIAELSSVKYGIGCASGSDALLLSLLACNIGYGDEVITTPFTFFSTAGSISKAGAKPVFCDIDPETFNISPNLIEEKITERTKVIIPVHLFGQCADMDPIIEIAERYGLRIIEDSAQAIGSSYKGRPACSMGDTGCLSFFPTKNLGGAGDGGMVVTSDEEICRKIRSLRVHGAFPRKYEHEMIGINSRLDAIQAVILLVKLRRLPSWTEKRRRNAKRYRMLFKEAELSEFVKLPVEKEENFHVYNQFVLRVERREVLIEELRKEGIGFQIYYPIPLHLQKCYRFLGYREGDFPESERACREVLAIPIYPELTQDMQERVVEVFKRFYTSS